MKLSTLEVSQLHFPRSEWKWSGSATRLDDSQETFLLGAKVGDRLWAWHPRGCDVDVGDAKSIPVLTFETDGTELAAHRLFLKLAAPEHGALKKPTLLSEAELKVAFAGNWDQAGVELLETVTPAVRGPLLAAVAKFGLSATSAKDAASNTLILARKMGEKTALKILSASYGGGDEFRLALFRTAQPELAQLADERIAALRDLKAPPRTSVHGDPSFENDALKITHNPRRLADFQLFREWVLDEETFEKMKALLEIYNQ